MEPIVLVGGGEVHYRLIQALKEENCKTRPIVLVTQDMKVLTSSILPYLIKTEVGLGEGLLDLWKACQRKGIYFLEDRCLNISREEQTLALKKFGKLKYHKLSIEIATQASCVGQELPPALSHMDFSKPSEFIARMKGFFAEVQKHCPREVRVVLTGFNTFNVQLALTIQSKLQGGAESTDLLILDSETEQSSGFFTSRKQKEISRLKKLGIRVMQGAVIQNVSDHLLHLSDGSKLSYDILVPGSHFRASDSLGKILQIDDQTIRVKRNLSDVRDSQIFITGNNVFFEREKESLFEFDSEELAQVLLHNIFVADSKDPLIDCRDRKKIDSIGWSKNWENRMRKQWDSLRVTKVLEPCNEKLNQRMRFQAEHMSRPWQGLLSHVTEEMKGQFRLNSFNGFNSWGSFAISAIKITEIAILKSLARGVKPQQLRFSLTLPVDEDHLLKHIFESTFKAIESVADKHGIEIDGGDTFDGKLWHLHVTVGGPSYSEPELKFNPHDYLLITRPLGFGFLWAGRLNDHFDSQWIQKAVQDPMLCDPENFLQFIEKWKPSGRVLIEEWGFLFHCLQRLPAHQQLMVNFREVPRWYGADFLIDKKVSHPGLEVNWRRIQEDVAFSREEISANNSVLWDSLSQGSLVFGVKAENWQQALYDLRQMGYKQATLVGCIRPKQKGTRVVLSDWSPSLET